jgi:hypothetical protein
LYTQTIIDGKDDEFQMCADYYIYTDKRNKCEQKFQNMGYGAKKPLEADEGRYFKDY